MAVSTAVRLFPALRPKALEISLRQLLSRVHETVKPPQMAIKTRKTNIENLASQILARKREQLTHITKSDAELVAQISGINALVPQG